MITVYSYDALGVYVGETIAREDPLAPGTYIMPGKTTTAPPPAVGANEAAVWNGTVWSIQTDARGTWYNIYNQAPTHIFDVGEPAPADATRIAPPPQSPYWQFNGAVWERTLDAAKGEKGDEIRADYDAAIEAPISINGHDYRLTGEFIALLEVAIEVQSGMVDVYDVEHNTFQVTQVDAQSLRDALYLGRLSEVLRRETALKAVADATDISTVDAISY